MLKLTLKHCLLFVIVFDTNFVKKLLNVQLREHLNSQKSIETLIYKRKRITVFNCYDI